MSDNFNKFLFLVAMITIVVFANRGTVAQQQLAPGYGGNEQKIRSVPPPIFVLQPPAKSFSDNLQAVVSASQLVRIAQNSIFHNTIATTTDSQAGLTTVVSTTHLDFNSGGLPTTSNDAFLQSNANPSQATFSRVASGEPPAIRAHIALVADFLRGENYFNLESTRRWPLASISKLMSAVVAIRNDNENVSTTLGMRDFPIENSDKNLIVGGRYSIKDLLLAALIESSNESAEGIANFFGREKFIAQMNSQAALWGLVNTNFDDPTGLSASNQSTAADLFWLARQIYEKYPEIFRITERPGVYVTELNSNKKFFVKSINNFAGRADFLGGKTGFTDEASGNLLSIFSYKNKPIIIIVLGTDDRFGDTEKLLNWFEANYQ